MYLLDTNVVSMLDPRRHAQAPDLINWLERNGAGIYLSVMTIAELEAGRLKLLRERKSKRAAEIAALMDEILADFGDHVLAMDIDTARLVAELGSTTYRQPVPLPDLIIAATARRHGLTLLTRNMREMSRLGILARDPFAMVPDDL